MSADKNITTPIYDFVTKYAKEENIRFHMPGHKGRDFSGLLVERRDITEISGADSLYEAEGIIRESEKNASWLFGSADTLYSTEGSSLCIRAMLYLCCAKFRESCRERPVIVAGRNAHRVFLTAAALLDFDIVWLWPENTTYSLCRCDISKEQLIKVLNRTQNVAGIYITSPDYLGNCADISTFSAIAKARRIPLLVDNAHGAYMRFLPHPSHPILEGAALCCDSAHKTLPVLTGGAYLHISKTAPTLFLKKARDAMAMFGSTSPSYLILQSLDLANRYIAEKYREKLALTVIRLQKCKQRLSEAGWTFLGDEPLKLTLDSSAYGYSGFRVGTYLANENIICEYADPDYVVLMLTPENTKAEIEKLEQTLLSLERRQPLLPYKTDFQPKHPKAVCSVREAVFSASKTLSPKNAICKTISSFNASCPPAVSPLVPGEVMTEEAAQIFEYYKISSVEVID